MGRNPLGDHRDKDHPWPAAKNHIHTHPGPDQTTPASIIPENHPPSEDPEPSFLHQGLTPLKSKETPGKPLSFFLRLSHSPPFNPELVGFLEKQPLQPNLSPTLCDLSTVQPLYREDTD